MPKMKMPANNRMHSSAALKTHDIWQTAIGYDPYAEVSKGDGGSGGGENAYSKFQDVVAAAQRERADLGVSSQVSGTCKKCGGVGHLTYQCRNLIRTSGAGKGNTSAKTNIFAAKAKKIVQEKLRSQDPVEVSRPDVERTSGGSSSRSRRYDDEVSRERRHKRDDSRKRKEKSKKSLRKKHRNRSRSPSSASESDSHRRKRSYSSDSSEDRDSYRKKRRSSSKSSRKHKSSSRRRSRSRSVSSSSEAGDSRRQRSNSSRKHSSKSSRRRERSSSLSSTGSSSAA